ncbi:MAG TPA: hypothetical protein VER35_02495, partial [Candidatus Limnocylindrales bacterium]|nr:hypothetical protein [Candidatus Limnocylindrales bacterium]
QTRTAFTILGLLFPVILFDIGFDWLSRLDLLSSLLLIPSETNRNLKFVSLNPHSARQIVVWLVAYKLEVN